MMNVHKMNGGAKTLGQVFRGFDSLDRHLREIDRHENILNYCSFHVDTMSCPCPPELGIGCQKPSIFCASSLVRHDRSRIRVLVAGLSEAVVSGEPSVMAWASE